MRIKSQEDTKQDCPQCKSRNIVSKLKRIVEEWAPFADIENKSYEIVVEICSCGYTIVTKDELQPHLKVPYRTQININA